MTNTETAITPEQFLAEVREIAEAKVAEVGCDYVYERQTPNPEATAQCLYVHDTDTGARPGCIIGVWLHTKRGIDLDDLRTVENETAENVLPTLLGGLVDDDTVYLADFLQRRQDEGTPWLDAVHRTSRHHVHTVDL